MFLTNIERRFCFSNKVKACGVNRKSNELKSYYRIW